VPQYLLLLYEPADTPPTPEESAAAMPKWAAFTQGLKEDGVFVAGEALERPDIATTVRSRDGEFQVTDGPFAETREALGGFYMIDVPDLDTALSYAQRVPNVHYGSVEVRPIWDWTGPRKPSAHAEATA
jgi:hypothetical protein